MEIDFCFTGIKDFYTYRSNRCIHTLIIYNVPFKYIKEYIEEQNYKMDNHISWRDNNGLCFTYSDHNLYIGCFMTNKSW